MGQSGAGNGGPAPSPGRLCSVRIHVWGLKAPLLILVEAPSPKVLGGKKHLKPESASSTQLIVAKTFVFAKGCEQGIPAVHAPPPQSQFLYPRYKIAGTITAFWSYYECVCPDTLVSACRVGSVSTAKEAV